MQSYVTSKIEQARRQLKTGPPAEITPQLATPDEVAAFKYAHDLDHRYGFIIIDGTRYENDRVYTLHLTPHGRHNSLRPHCFRCVQGQPVVNLAINGETPGGCWGYVTIVPKYQPCKRRYQGKEVICIKAMHSSWFTLENPRIPEQ